MFIKIINDMLDKRINKERQEVFDMLSPKCTSYIDGECNSRESIIKCEIEICPSLGKVIGEIKC